MKSLNTSKMPQKKLSLKSIFFAESHLFSFLCFWFTLDPILSSNTVVYLCLLLQFFWSHVWLPLHSPAYYFFPIISRYLFSPYWHRTLKDVADILSYLSYILRLPSI